MEVPQLSDLDGLPVEITWPDEPGVVRLTSRASDGSVVAVTWDETAGSVHVLWTDGDEERLRIYRETVAKVSVRHVDGRVEFWVWSDGGGSGGQLVVDVGSRVRVADALLRK